MVLRGFLLPQNSHFLIFILGAITLVEYIFAYQNVAYGIVLALALVVLIYFAVSLPERENDVTRAAESLALVPLYILFTSSLPWFFVEQVYLLPAVYSIVLALVLLHMYDKQITPESLGLTFRGSFRWIVLCSILAIPTGTIEYLVLRPEPAAPSFELTNLLRDFVYMLLFVGLAEEILFRGLIQRDLQRVFVPWKGLFLASYLFGVMHMTWRSVAELLFTFFAVLLMGPIRFRVLV
jgi:membrane protease YdiL (CAAX protease family)